MRGRTHFRNYDQITKAASVAIPEKVTKCCNTPAVNKQTLVSVFFLLKQSIFLFTKLSQKVSMSKTHKYNSGKYAHTSW